MELPLVYKCQKIEKELLPFKKELGLHYDDFSTIVTGKIFGQGNFSKIVRSTVESPSVSSLCRFYDEGDPEEINKIYRRKFLKLVRKKPERYLFALDDTIIEKFGKNIWGTYYWYDNCKQATVWGQKILFLGVVDIKIKKFIPIFWVILHRQESESGRKKESKEMNEKKGNQVEEKANHKTGIEVALELVKKAVKEGFPKFTLVFDSWFCSNWFMESLNKIGIEFVGEIKSNRLLKDEKNPRTDPLNVSEFFRERPRSKIIHEGKGKWSASIVTNLNACEIEKLKIVAVANNKGLRHGPFAYYVSNRTHWDATKIWRISRLRWAIEVQFRELKQLFTFGEAPVRSKKAVEIHLSMSAIALSVIRCIQLAIPDASKNQYTRPVPALAIVQQLKLASLSGCISNLVSGNKKELLEIKMKLDLKNYREKPKVGRKINLLKQVA